MDYETFQNAVIASLEKHFGETASVSVHSFTRNNGIQLDGFTIEEHAKCLSPTLYFEPYYDDFQAGKPFSAILEEIIRFHRSHLPDEEPDLSFFKDFEQVKPLIIYKLVDYAHNRQLLEQIPHFRYLDLAVVFCCMLKDTFSESVGFILIENKYLDKWNATPDMLYDLAKANTPHLLPAEFSDMMKKMIELCMGDISVTPEFCPDETEPFPLFILSNDIQMYGAACLLYPNILAEFAARHDCDFYILPSSVHEVLLLPTSAPKSPDMLNAMVQEINEEHVAPEEILSDHVYCFRRADGFVSMPSTADPDTDSDTLPLNFSMKSPSSCPGVSDSSTPSCSKHTAP